MESKSFNLSFVGFSKNETNTFLAILSLAERGLQHYWHVVGIEYADFFILATEKSESEELIKAKNLPRERCLFCTRQALHFSEYDTDVLFLAEGKTPLLSSVVKVLNHAANVSFTKQIISDNLLIEPVIETAPVITSSSDDSFDPERGFLKHLLLLLQDKTEYMACRFGSPDGIYKIYVDPIKKVYFCETSLTDLSAYLIIKDVFVIDVISEPEWYAEIEKLALPAKSLTNLIWYVTFKLSNGRLLRGHSNQDYVYLTRWPDLGIEGCGQYVKLAAFMRHNAVCLTIVADKTNMPLTEVYNFYNACYLIGIVEKVEKPEIYAKTLDEDKQQILKKITSRLNTLTVVKKERLDGL